MLSTEDRKARLQQIRDTGNPVGLQRLFYKDENRDFSVYRIDLDLLIYNRHNGRIEAEMLTWEQENQALGEYDEALDKLIDNLLWDSSEARNKATLEDLAKKDQQRPAIVTLDGVIIDGNRRAMLLRRLAASLTVSVKSM